MAFVLPNFNLTVNIWNPPAGPPGLPSVIVLGNLAYSRRAHIQAPYSPGPAPVPIVPMYLLLPALTDVRDPFNGAALQSILESQLDQEGSTNRCTWMTPAKGSPTNTESAWSKKRWDHGLSQFPKKSLQSGGRTVTLGKAN